MTSPIAAKYRTKRVYAPEGRRQLRLSDRIVELGEQEFDWYQKVAAWLPSVRGLAELSREARDGRGQGAEVHRRAGKRACSTAPTKRRRR